MKFRLWLEKNIFGFEDEPHQKVPYRPAKAPLRGPQDLPIERLNVQRVIECLAKYDLGVRKSSMRFFNECQWGEKSGSIRALITPKINVKIQRYHYDMDGNGVWIMKKYFFIDDVNFAGKEDVVAMEIFDQVKRINDEQHDVASQDNKLRELVSGLSSKMNTLESDNLMPTHVVKKTSDNEYNLYYNLRGGGVGGYSGAATVRNVMEVVVNLSYQKDRGLIKAIVTVVTDQKSGSKGGSSWVLVPSDFEEYFMPSQGHKEIIESVLTALKTY